MFEMGVILFFGAIFGGLCFVVAESKGHNGYLWGGLGFLFWLIPLIIVFVLPEDTSAYESVQRHRERKQAKKNEQRIIALARSVDPANVPAPAPVVERFQCPECGESIPVAAKFCRFCNCILSDSDKANA